MKNLEKIIKNILILFWIGLSCSILKAEVVITEIFIRTDSVKTPQYIELYNNSVTPVYLSDWSITTYDSDSGGVEIYPVLFYPTSVINPFGYFLISSSFCNYHDFGCEFHNGTSDIISPGLILPFDDPYWNYDDKGSIVLRNGTYNIIDSVGYNFAKGWPVSQDSKGHSLRLHVAPNSIDNDSLKNWSLSPETEKSIWLYDAGEEIKSFGSPREENSFRLKGNENFIHIISGDVNNVYNADNNYEYNNYANPINFSWYGTFDNVSDQQYKLIIEKTGTKIPEKHGFEIILYPDKDTTLNWGNIIDTTISIFPQDLSVAQLEVADYSWTLELTKGSDIIYSDLNHFSIDASNYGYYGCTDESICKIGSLGFPTCPTTVADDTLISSHPIECIPGVNCYSAINFDENANINSSTCHYVSLSIPAFVIGDTNTIATVPIYFTNDSLAEINEIEFVLNFDNSLGILSYKDGTFSETIISSLGVSDGNIIDDQNGNISVSIPISSLENSFSGAGIITYINLDLVGEQGVSTYLSLSTPRVKGGIPINDIEVPESEGEVAILQTNYEISGQVYYYLRPPESVTTGEPIEVPNVVSRLRQKYIGELTSITTADLAFEFEELTVGNYNLSFSKSSEDDYCNNGIAALDSYYISRHVTGSEPFDSSNIDHYLIAADVSLDGTVSGYDASLVAQYSVDLIDNFNTIHTHWIFKPENTLNVHSKLLEHNGTYSIDYTPLILDDKTRTILAYRLGEVTGDYCSNQFVGNRGQFQFTDIVIDYTPVITLPIFISEPTLIKGMDIEIGYDENIFNPLSITLNHSKKVIENYQTVSNLLSKDRTIKTVTWAIEKPQIVKGKIGEVSFTWNKKNKNGKIWLKKFQINDELAVGGISLIGLSNNDVVDGVNIITSLVPLKLSLHQNYPNPFNPQTTIKWSMPLSDEVSLEVYNLQGQLVELLFNGHLDAGIHEQIWDATAYPSGVYFCRMTTHNKTLQRVMLLLK